MSLELGSEAVCRRVLLVGGDNRGLLGLLTSLLGSLCSSEFWFFLLDDERVLEEMKGLLPVPERLVFTMLLPLVCPLLCLPNRLQTLAQ